MRKSSGFTLFEIMMAITITVIILTIVYASYTTAITSMENSRKRINVYGTARPVLDQISRDIGCAYFNPDDERTAFIGTPDTLNFITLAHRRSSRDAKESDTSEVGYYISTEFDTPLLIRRESMYLDGEPTEGGDVSVIADNVTAISFQYYGEDGWIDSWEAVGGEEDGEEGEGGGDAEEEGAFLPRAVSITLNIIDSAGDTWVFSTDTVIPLGGEKEEEEEDEEEEK